MVFKITKDEIELRGLIDHSKGEQYYRAAVERSLYIGDLLYTKSLGLLRINALEDFEFDPGETIKLAVEIENAEDAIDADSVLMVMYSNDFDITMIQDEMLKVNLEAGDVFFNEFLTDYNYFTLNTLVLLLSKNS